MVDDWSAGSPSLADESPVTYGDGNGRFFADA
jgi:hypothetical protein